MAQDGEISSNFLDYSIANKIRIPSSLCKHLVTNTSDVFQDGTWHILNYFSNAFPDAASNLHNVIFSTNNSDLFV